MSGHTHASAIMAKVFLAFPKKKKKNAKSLAKLAKIACYLAVSCITNWNEKKFGFIRKV